MFSIPVSASGVDEQGRLFEVAGRTINLSRHGARVQLSHLLKLDQILHVVNQLNHAEADFRVVSVFSPPLEHVGEWGIECLQEDTNIWDIHFPPLAAEADAHALLECRGCHTLALQPLSLVEVEVLETAGLLSSPCPHCEARTAWGYTLRTFEVESKTYQAAAAGEIAPLNADRRNAPRKPAQLPARLRNYYGEVEVVQTENNSPDGFCFVSNREYLIGQGILVVCPFQAGNERPELRARIVREGLAGCPAQHLYGARYERATS
jgi:hypothetical protein